MAPAKFYVLLAGCIVFNAPIASAEDLWFGLAAAPDGAYGWSKVRQTKDAAEEEAFRNCASASKKPQDCRVVIVPKGSCGAVTQCTNSGEETVWITVSERLKNAMDESLRLAVSAGIAKKNCKLRAHWCPE